MSALAALLASPRKRGTDERASTEAALLHLALSLYVRATSTAGSRGERGSFDIRAKLTPEQSTDHTALLEVRNRALAHVYVSEQAGGELWHREQLFLVETPAGWRPCAVSKRVQLHGGTLERLRRQLPVATAIVGAAFHRRMDRVIDLCNSVGVPAALMEKHRTDPLLFFGSEANVLQALAGMRDGRAHGYI